ncbi:M15 family metallopeptidase [Veronia pacifica]|uniref:Peptidase M15C domain-containing protein n=1 Tax=Veronia pacifica TaxID=1080227 RepID=A0A1C3ESW4_9GAMM|nr:M15 family metallopeptidase [Veronia pacifica]ODA36294.1 hypothetical protein A8L45_01465 [Veronia pacifica]
MTTFYLGERSLKRLDGVHEDLIRVVRHAIKLSSVDFSVLEGCRTVNRQQQLLEAGATTTMKSRHLTGHAVDLGAYLCGQIHWDWPLYWQIADAMKEAADKEAIAIQWGGDWKTFPDGPHFELSWQDYPP